MIRRFDSVDPGLRTLARGQRRTMPMAEALFWQQVRAGRLNGLKFRRQVPIPPYVADFLCASARVIVELDGAPHQTPQRKARDAKRDAWLAEQGFRVLRFPNDLVLGNLGLVLEAVMAAVSAALPPPSAGEGTLRSRRGEGSEGAGYGVGVAADVRDGCTPSGTVAPLSRPSLTRSPPSPAEGGGKDARDMSRGRSPPSSEGGKATP